MSEYQKRCSTKSVDMNSSYGDNCNNIIVHAIVRFDYCCHGLEEQIKSRKT